MFKLFFYAIIFIFQSIHGHSEKIDGKIDIVIVPPNHMADASSLKTALSSFPSNHFHMDDEKIHLALVDSSWNSIDKELIIPLTSNLDQYEMQINYWKPSKNLIFSAFTAFRVINDKIFTDHTDRAKIIVIFMNLQEFYEGPEYAGAEAKRLRDAGVFIYVIYTQADHEHLEKMRSDALNWTASESRVMEVQFNSTDYHDTNYFKELFEAFENLKSKIYEDLCSWNGPHCIFDDHTRQECHGHVWQSKMNEKYFDDPNRCQSIKPISHLECNLDDCNRECDLRWPWNDPKNCGVMCGESVTRNGSVPPEKMENCLAEIECPKCQVEGKEIRESVPEFVKEPIKSDPVEKFFVEEIGDVPTSTTEPSEHYDYDDEKEDVQEGSGQENPFQKFIGEPVQDHNQADDHVPIIVQIYDHKWQSQEINQGTTENIQIEANEEKSPEDHVQIDDQKWQGTTENIQIKANEQKSATDDKPIISNAKQVATSNAMFIISSINLVIVALMIIFF